MTKPDLVFDVHPASGCGVGHNCRSSGPVPGLRAAAAIASDGNRFEVLSIEDLEQALGEDGEAQVGGVRGPEIVRVETARLAPLRLDLSDLAADAVNAALDGLNLDAAIVSLGSTAAGGRAATILGKFESDVMRAVRPVYQCPKGLETYSSPGHLRGPRS